MYLLTAKAILFGLGAITCIVVWKLYFEQSGSPFSWRENPGRMFDWHPLLMTLSIFFAGVGALTYRTVALPRGMVKAMHATFMILSCGGGAIGLWAVLDSRLLAATPQNNHFTSLHSWIGIFTLGLLAFQFLAGFCIYLFPCCSTAVKAGYYPFHKYFGLGVLGGSVAAALMGLTEEALFTMPDYMELPERGILVNIYGCCLFLFAALVIFITSFKGFRIYH